MMMSMVPIISNWQNNLLGNNPLAALSARGERRMKMENFAYRIEARMVKEEDFPYNRTPIKHAEDVYNFCKVLQDADIEKLLVLFLSNANEINCIQIIPGTISSAVVYPREIIKCAILSGSRSIIVIHNHPMGKLKPSDADTLMTRKIKDACKIMDLTLLDHFIINTEGYFSFQEKGLL